MSKGRKIATGIFPLETYPRSDCPIPRRQPTRAPLRHGTRDAEGESRQPPPSSSSRARLPDDVSIKHPQHPFPLNPTTTTTPHPPPVRHILSSADSFVVQKQIPVSPSHTRHTYIDSSNLRCAPHLVPPHPRVPSPTCSHSRWTVAKSQINYLTPPTRTLHALAAASSCGRAMGQMD